MTTLLLLLLLLLPLLVLSNICSTNVLFTSETVDLYNEDRRRYTEETQVLFNIGLKETVCFEAKDTSNPDSPLTVYSLTFSDVESIFTYKNSYEFAMGSPDVTCVCDCPGLEDHCSPNRNSCREDGRTGEGCWNFYKGDEPSDGCGLFAPMGAAEICCSVQFQAFRGKKFKAFEISTPITRGTFNFESTVGEKKEVRKDFVADLDKGSKIFLQTVAISFETPGKTVPIPDGWYFGASRSTEVFTNVKINSLNEWDVNKLGWLKYSASGDLQYHKVEISPVFSAKTVDCKENSVNVDFASDYHNREVKEAQTLESYYSSTVQTARRADDSRHIIVTFRQYDKLKAMLTFPGRMKVFQHFSAASFDDFTGVALLDKHSNRVLNITVFRGVGKLHGSMKQAGESVESFDFIIESTVKDEKGEVVPVDYNNYVQITQWCTNSGKTELCLHTGDSNVETCKAIFCEAEENRQFEIPRTAIDYTAGRRESLSDGAVWVRYTNPAEWFNGLTGLQETVCMLTVLACIVLMAVVVVLVIKKTKLKYHLTLLWARFPLLREKYAAGLISYAEEGLGREQTCKVRCPTMCCRRRYDSDDDSSDQHSELSSINSMVRNYYEYEESRDNYYEDIERDSSEDQRGHYPPPQRDPHYSDSSDHSMSYIEDKIW